LLDGNSSGHLLGSAAAVILLGPLVGCATMATVLVVQAVLLGDGGLTALGPNILNMALVSPLAAWGTYELVRRARNDAVGSLVAAMAAGWVASVSAASVCAAELAVSGVGSFGNIAATLVAHHALLGLVEGFATAALVFAMMPQSLASSPAAFRTMRLYPALVATALVLACLPLSSELPDTLEVVLAPPSIVNE
jgi:cobalt/nickel transport system permease protein